MIQVFLSSSTTRGYTKSRCREGERPEDRWGAGRIHRGPRNTENSRGPWRWSLTRRWPAHRALTLQVASCQGPARVQERARRRIKPSKTKRSNLTRRPPNPLSSHFTVRPLCARAFSQTTSQCQTRISLHPSPRETPYPGPED